MSNLPPRLPRCANFLTSYIEKQIQKGNKTITIICNNPHEATIFTSISRFIPGKETTKTSQTLVMNVCFPCSKSSCRLRLAGFYQQQAHRNDPTWVCECCSWAHRPGLDPDPPQGMTERLLQLNQRNFGKRTARSSMRDGGYLKQHHSSLLSMSDCSRLHVAPGW